MKVTAIETIHTDQGLTGLGDTSYGPAAAEGHVHGIIAPALIGKDARNVEGIQASLAGYVGFVGASAEMRGRSAIEADI